MVAQIDMKYVRTSPVQTIKRLVSYSLFEGRPLTTKGQWINPLVFFHFAIEKKLPQLKKIEKPIFIVGTGRSGTTILGVLLSMHKNVGFLNEPKALWHSIYSKEDVIGSYSRSAAKYVLNENDATLGVPQAAHKLFGAYLRGVGSTRLVDKYPELVFRISFVKKIFPDAKFVFLVRNGWDTCYSIESWSKRLGKRKNTETHDWWGANDRKWNLMLDELVSTCPLLKQHINKIRNFECHTDRACVEWIVTMQEGMRQSRNSPDAIYQIKYEDLTHAPEYELQKLLDFCELKKDEKFFKYALSRLSSAPIHPKFEIAQEVLPAFEQTMQELGY